MTKQIKQFIEDLEHGIQSNEDHIETCRAKIYNYQNEIRQVKKAMEENEATILKLKTLEDKE